MAGDRCWPYDLLQKNPALLLITANTYTFPTLLSWGIPTQQQEPGIRHGKDFLFHCRARRRFVFHSWIPPQSQEKLCSPSGSLTKWTNSISVITAHTKHKSPIGSTHIALNITNNPNTKASVVDGAQNDLQDLKLSHGQDFSFDHSLQVLLGQSRAWCQPKHDHICTSKDGGLDQVSCCKIVLQYTKLTYLLCTRESKISQT